MLRAVPLLAVLVVCAVWYCGSAACAQEPNGLAAAAAIQEAFVKAIETAEKSVVNVADRDDGAVPRGFHRCKRPLIS
jgi:ribosomal protein S12 methylthiotransferase accessory factor YcaO